MSKVWLITGSGNGLGRDIAEAALAAGDSVVAGARRTEELAPLVAQHGERVKPVTGWKCAMRPPQRQPCSWRWTASGVWTC
jgi:NAD(P)-dependent dehydrogenase (short-subunit alcohol dehydrogenase family)